MVIFSMTICDFSVCVCTCLGMRGVCGCSLACVFDYVSNEQSSELWYMHIFLGETLLLMFVSKNGCFRRLELLPSLCGHHLWKVIGLVSGLMTHTCTRSEGGTKCKSNSDYFSDRVLRSESAQ